jgi:glucose/arabinose dehydrogenase
MSRNSWIGLVLALLLSCVLAGCGGIVEEVGTAGPVVVVSPQESVTPTATAASPGPTFTPVPSRPMLTPGSQDTVLSSTPTSAAQSPVPPSATPSPVSRDTEPASTPTSAVPSPAPPAATPTFTPTAAAGRGADLTAVGLTLQKVLGGLETPVGLAHAGDGSGRLFILEKVGRIRVVHDRKLDPVPFLDITDRVGSAQSERGLLGLAFHPYYVDNGFLFVNYTDRQGSTVVARFSVGDNPAQADPASETILLTVEQPAANHNGGHLAFGPDGYLYVGTGDGGGAGDQFGNGQNGATLLGSMLRLDIDRGQGYAVPADNPFVADPAVRDEIWAIGLRNPWRFAFDSLTGDLYVADVGQSNYEEINFQPADAPGGRNYGWPIMEAAHCFPQDRACERTGMTLPVVEYDHAQGCSVTGGYVYRGREFPSLNGIYLFGDYCSGRIWGLVRDTSGEWQVAELAHFDIRLSSFGEDQVGEMYLLDMERGDLFGIVARSQ